MSFSVTVPPLILFVQIASLSSTLSNLEDLQIGSNRIQSLSLEATLTLNFPNLRILNLEGNLLESWDEVDVVLEALPRSVVSFLSRFLAENIASDWKP